MALDNFPVTVRCGRVLIDLPQEDFVVVQHGLHTSSFITMRHIKQTLFIWSTYVCRMIIFEVLDLCRLHYCIDHLSFASLPIDISWSRFVDTCICYSLVILFCNRACRVHFSLTSSSTAFCSTICRGFIVDMSVFYVRARVIFFCSRFNTSSHVYVCCYLFFFA